MTHDSLGLVVDLSPDEVLGLVLLFAACLGVGTLLGAAAALLTFGRRPRGAK